MMNEEKTESVALGRRYMFFLFLDVNLSVESMKFGDGPVDFSSAVKHLQGVSKNCPTFD